MGSARRGGRRRPRRVLACVWWRRVLGGLDERPLGRSSACVLVLQNSGFVGGCLTGVCRVVRSLVLAVSALLRDGWCSRACSCSRSCRDCVMLACRFGKLLACEGRRCVAAAFPEALLCARRSAHVRGVADWRAVENSCQAHTARSPSAVSHSAQVEMLAATHDSRRRRRRGRNTDNNDEDLCC